MSLLNGTEGVQMGIAAVNLVVDMAYNEHQRKVELSHHGEDVARSEKMHAEQIAEAKRLHRLDMERALDIHKKEMQVARQAHMQDVILTKQTHLMSTYTDIEMHFSQVRSVAPLPRCLLAPLHP